MARVKHKGLNRKIKRRRLLKVERLSATGKCKKCDSPYLYSFEGATKEEIESNRRMAKRFVEVQEKELCLRCLTVDSNLFTAYEKMQFYVLKGNPISKEDNQK